MSDSAQTGKTALRAVIGESVRMTRLRKRLSQRTVAEMAGVSRLAVISLEGTAGVQLETAERVMGALGLSVSITESAA
jgi:transcriptional regulator with XRE-family HTH domain